MKSFDGAPRIVDAVCVDHQPAICSMRVADNRLPPLRKFVSMALGGVSAPLSDLSQGHYPESAVLRVCVNDLPS